MAKGKNIYGEQIVVERLSGASVKDELVINTYYRITPLNIEQYSDAPEYLHWRNGGEFGIKVELGIPEAMAECYRYECNHIVETNLIDATRRILQEYFLDGRDAFENDSETEGFFTSAEGNHLLSLIASNFVECYTDVSGFTDSATLTLSLNKVCRDEEGEVDNEEAVRTLQLF